MGLFSSKKKTYVGMSVSRLMQDEDIVNPSKAAIIDAITSGSSIAENLLHYNANSYYKSVKQMRKYAIKFNYPYGSPRLESMTNAGDAPVENYIRDEFLGNYQNLVLHHLSVGYRNYDIYVKDFLASVWKFNKLLGVGVVDEPTSSKFWLEDTQFYFNPKYREEMDEGSYEKVGYKYNSFNTPYRTYNNDIDPQTQLPINPTPEDNSLDMELLEGFSYALVTAILRTPTITATKRFYDYDSASSTWVLNNALTTVTETNKLDDFTILTSEKLNGVVDSNDPNLIVYTPISTTTTTEIDVTTEEGLDPLVSKVTLQTTSSYYDYRITLEVSLAQFGEEVLETGGYLEDVDDPEDTLYDGDEEGLPNHDINDTGDYVNIYAEYVEDTSQGLPDPPVYEDRLLILSGTLDDITGLSAYINTAERLPFGTFVPNFYLRYQGKKENRDELKETLVYKSTTRILRKMGIKFSDFVDDVHESIPSLNTVDSILFTWGASLSDTYETPTHKPNPLVCHYIHEFYWNLYTRGLTGEQTLSVSDDRLNGTFGYKDIILLSDNVLTDEPDGYYADSTNTAGYTTVRVKNGVKRTLQVIAPFSHRKVRGKSTTEKDYKKNDALHVPYDLGLIDLMGLTLKERNMLTGACALLLFLTYRVVKTKWYQRGIFKALILVVGIVLAIVFPPAGGWTVAAALTTFGIGIAVTVAVDLVIRLMIALGFSASLVQIFAVVAAVVATLMASPAGGTQITAKTLLAAVNSGFKAISNATQYTAARTMASIQKEIDKMTGKLEELTAEIKELNIDSLEYIKDIMLRNMMEYFPGETPEEFIGRTTMVSVSDLSLKAVYEYTQLRLQLPLGSGAFNLHQQTLEQRLAALSMDI